MALKFRKGHLQGWDKNGRFRNHKMKEDNEIGKQGIARSRLYRGAHEQRSCVRTKGRSKAGLSPSKE